MALPLTDLQERFAKEVKAQNSATRVLGVTELNGRYVRNFPKIFGADELLDKKDLGTRLIATLRLVAKGEDYGIRSPLKPSLRVTPKK